MKLSLLLVLALSACAAPAAEQGRSAQGGSATAPQLSLTVNNFTGHDVGTTNTSAPAAAPSSASEASAEQHATSSPTVSANVGTDAVKAALAAFNVATAAGKTVEEATAAGNAAAAAVIEKGKAAPVPTIGAK